MKRFLALLLFCATSAFAQAAPQITVSWGYLDADVVTWGVTGFQLQRKTDTTVACTGAVPFVNLIVVAPTLRAYVDTAIVPGTIYCYRAFAMAPVTALNPQGNSGFSNVGGKLVTLSPPPPPANLLVTFINALIDALETLKTGLLELK